MPYKIVVPDRVQKQIDALPCTIWQRVRSAIDRLEVDPRPHTAIKMKGSSESWRIRVGDHRIIYTIEDDQLVVLIVKVGNRREVYR
ncbi:type II toxin-antitoxin system RelE family toxin [Candidatus Magnetaquicoccus inordinatus]|uniref:type II toxin-antitoxin system RelE family toxin n=1 Tax=Candidatus Magnetaquicoccus inordinatus TaxID=2496818 RepID=UPI00102C6AD6|nr:type II toxin-antitoxin system RelE/ParE family toxin [Candidatus Magnetaquicoccus inordinatus]